MTVNTEIRTLARQVMTDRQYDAWNLDIAGVSQREAAYRLGITRSTLVSRLDAADHALRRAGVLKSASGNYYLEGAA